MAFYEKQKRKQVTSGYKIKMSGLHHGLLGGKERRDGRSRCALSLSGLFFATRNEVEKAGNRASRSAFRSVSSAVAVVVLDDQTRLADNAKVMCHRGLGHLDAEAKLHEALVAER